MILRNPTKSRIAVFALQPQIINSAENLCIFTSLSEKGGSAIKMIFYMHVYGITITTRRCKYIAKKCIIITSG